MKSLLSNSDWGRDLYSAIFCLLSVAGLLITWVLPGTIALRHLFLLAGLFSGLLFIFENRFELFRRPRAFWPLFLLASLFIWVIIHYSFFSMNPALERMEITGLWARTFVSAMLGVSVVLSLKKYPQLCFIFFMAIFLPQLSI